MSLRPRPEIEGLNGCIHGGPDYRELERLGLSADRILDFSVCCNPYPPPAGVRNSLRTLKFDRYPDTNSGELTLKLARKLGISADTILTGSGTTELIRLIALAFFSPGDEVLVVKPTYGEYELASRISGAKIREFIWQISVDREIQVAGLVDSLLKHPVKAVFICNPNNPTGVYFSRAEIESVLAACSGCLLVLDEAYISFVEEAWNSADLISSGSLIILRSMTKDYALAGLRLGYAMASADIIQVLKSVCPPWNVNVAAQKAGCAALEASGYLATSKARVTRSKQYLVREFEKMGLDPVPSRANFFLVKTGNGKEFRSALLKHGILVRDCASFGLPEYIRLAPRTLAECKRFIQTVRLLKQEGKI